MGVKDLYDSIDFASFRVVFRKVEIEISYTCPRCWKEEFRWSYAALHVSAIFEIPSTCTK